MIGIDYINSLEPWDHKSDFGLDAITKVLEYLGNPQDKPRSVHIAGTNGKGSVAVAMAAILSSAGYSVGLNTSPHLVRINERFIINGIPIRDQLISDTALIIREAINAIGVDLTYHEFLTALAFEAFKDLDWIVIETGLGGRLDASNVIKSPEIAIITSIGLDHQNILGDSLEKIAAEKAGIIKANSRVVIGKIAEPGRVLISDKCERTDSELIELEGEYSRFRDYNEALVKLAAEQLDLSDQVIQEGLCKYQWPGRMESIGFRDKKFLFDAAHNPDATAHLVSEISGTKFDIIFGVLNTKDWKEMAKLLSPHIVNWNIVSPDSVAAQDSLEIENYLSGIGVKNFRNFSSDYQSAFEHVIKSDSKNILVTGSLYMLAEVREQVQGMPSKYW